MGTKKFSWKESEDRKHEKLAVEIIRDLMASNAEISLQTAFISVELRVDITMDGADVRYMLPPQLAAKAAHYALLVELESGTLGIAKFQRMLTTLMNAHVRYTRDQRKASTPTSKRPMLVVYARKISPALMTLLKPTPEKGVFRFSIHNLHIYLIDNSRVPSDSEYVHLRLLYAPSVHTEEAFETTVLEQYRQAIQFSTVPLPLLEKLIMTSTQQLFSEIDKREELRFTSLVDAHEQGERKGERRGKREGKLEGKREGKLEERRENARIQRQGLVQLAEARGLRLTQESIARLDACEDPHQLSQWTLEIGTAEGPIVELK